MGDGRRPDVDRRRDGSPPEKPFVHGHDRAPRLDPAEETPRRREASPGRGRRRTSPGRARACTPSTPRSGATRAPRPSPSSAASSGPTFGHGVALDAAPARRRTARRDVAGALHHLDRQRVGVADDRDGREHRHAVSLRRKSSSSQWSIEKHDVGSPSPQLPEREAGAEKPAPSVRSLVVEQVGLHVEDRLPFRRSSASAARSARCRRLGWRRERPGRRAAPPDSFEQASEHEQTRAPRPSTRAGTGGGSCRAGGRSRRSSARARRIASRRTRSLGGGGTYSPFEQRARA